MKTSNKLIHKPDGGMIIDENDDDLYRPSTPEELREAEARLEAFGKKCDERRSQYEKEKSEKEKKR